MPALKELFREHKHNTEDFKVDVLLSSGEGDGDVKPDDKEAVKNYIANALCSVENHLPGRHDQKKHGRKKGFKPPKKTITVYKQFRRLKSRPGELFPLFIGKSEPTPIGEWIPAEFIPTKGFSPRPGWHAGKLPIAPHLRTKENKIADDRVWAEVEVPADVDWQSVADEQRTKDIRGEVPEGGFYRFKRPQHQGSEWIIAGAIKVNRVLSDAHVRKILRSAGEEEAAAFETHNPFVVGRIAGKKPTRNDVLESKNGVWRTIRGAKVFIEGGVITKGPKALKGKTQSQAVHTQRRKTGRKKPEIERAESKQLFKAALDDGGFTYDPINDTSPTSGKAVAIFTDTEKAIPFDRVNEQVIFDYLKKHKGRLKDPRVYAGGWHDTEAGLFYLDLSVVVDTDKQAMRLAKTHNQEGYYDFDTQKTVIVKADEERRLATHQGRFSKAQISERCRSAEISERVYREVQGSLSFFEQDPTWNHKGPGDHPSGSPQSVHGRKGVLTKTAQNRIKLLEKKLKNYLREKGWENIDSLRKSLDIFKQDLKNGRVPSYVIELEIAARAKQLATVEDIQNRIDKLKEGVPDVKQSRFDFDKDREQWLSEKQAEIKEALERKKARAARRWSDWIEPSEDLEPWVKEGVGSGSEGTISDWYESDDYIESMSRFENQEYNEVRSIIEEQNYWDYRKGIDESLESDRSDIEEEVRESWAEELDIAAEDLEDHEDFTDIRFEDRVGESMGQRRDFLIEEYGRGESDDDIMEQTLEELSDRWSNLDIDEQLNYSTMGSDAWSDGDPSLDDGSPKGNWSTTVTAGVANRPFKIDLEETGIGLNTSITKKIKEKYDDPTYTLSFHDDEESYDLTGKGDAREVMQKVAQQVSIAMKRFKPGFITFSGSREPKEKTKDQEGGRIGMYRFLVKRAPLLFPGYKGVEIAPRLRKSSTQFGIIKEDYLKDFGDDLDTEFGDRMQVYNEKKKYKSIKDFFDNATFDEAFWDEVYAGLIKPEVIEREKKYGKEITENHKGPGDHPSGSSQSVHGKRKLPSKEIGQKAFDLVYGTRGSGASLLNPPSLYPSLEVIDQAYPGWTEKSQYVRAIGGDHDRLRAIVESAERRLAATLKTKDPVLSQGKNFEGQFLEEIGDNTVVQQILRRHEQWNHVVDNPLTQEMIENSQSFQDVTDLVKLKGIEDWKAYEKKRTKTWEAVEDLKVPLMKLVHESQKTGNDQDRIDKDLEKVFVDSIKKFVKEYSTERRKKEGDDFATAEEMEGISKDPFEYIGVWDDAFKERTGVSYGIAQIGNNIETVDVITKLSPEYKAWNDLQDERSKMKFDLIQKTIEKGIGKNKLKIEDELLPGKNEASKYWTARKETKTDMVNVVDRIQEIANSKVFAETNVDPKDNSVNRKELDTLKFNWSLRNGRANYNDHEGEGIVTIDFDSPKTTIAHEIGHALEFANPAIMKRANEFREMRVKRSETKDVPMKNYGEYFDDDEIGNEDNFGKYFALNKNGSRSAAYVGKIYEDGATEIISMGMEPMTGDYSPFTFALDDPEYFAFMKGILNGELVGEKL